MCAIETVWNEMDAERYFSQISNSSWLVENICGEKHTVTFKRTLHSLQYVIEILVLFKSMPEKRNPKTADLMHKHDHFLCMSNNEWIQTEKSFVFSGHVAISQAPVCACALLCARVCVWKIGNIVRKLSAPLRIYGVQTTDADPYTQSHIHARRTDAYATHTKQNINLTTDTQPQYLYATLVMSLY